MAMVLQQTSTFYGGRDRKLYAVIMLNSITQQYDIADWTDDKSKATSASTRELREWMRAMVERLNQCPRLENGEVWRFYALRYRRPASMNRVCSKCAIQRGEKND